MDCDDVVFNSGFQNDSQPSQGIGGNYPGTFTRTVFALGQNRNYYVSIPPDYDVNKPIPLLFTWHGAGGAGTAPAYALAHRDFWKSTGDSNNFIVVAQESTGASGGWVPTTDFLILSIILQDMYDNYNIELTRIYGHGFSAGAHVLHGLMLQNSEDYAAYIISAGVLEAYAGINAPENTSRVIPLYVSIGLNDTLGPNLNNLTHTNHPVFINAGWEDDKTYWLNEFNGGHEIDADVRQDSWDKLCTFSKLQ
jgi:poly(3-hydroxybutyrate) depolymerase